MALMILFSKNIIGMTLRLLHIIFTKKFWKIKGKEINGMRKNKRIVKKSVRVIRFFIISLIFIGIAASITILGCNYLENQNFKETFYCVNEWCECHRTEEPYSVDFCLTKEREKKAEHIKEVYRQFSESRNGRVCENHMRYVEKTDSIEFSYTPSHCAVACFHPDFFPLFLVNRMVIVSDTLLTVTEYPHKDKHFFTQYYIL